MNQLIIKQASSQIGVKEIAGSEHNMTIVQYAQDIGAKWVKDDETPWCAIFVNWVLFKCGYKYSSNASARSFETYGVPPTEPEPGDIVVFWRQSINSGLGHVGIFIGYSSNRQFIYVLGGNQSNSVSITKYSIANVIGFRRVSEQVLDLEIPTSNIGRGDKGPDVAKLQTLLRYFGITTAKVDGDFGPNSEAALKAFQTKYKLPVNGKYTPVVQNTFFTLLNS